MKKGTFQRLLPHLIALVIFLVVAAIYCRPVLGGKVLQQHDVTQWKAMAQDQFEYKEKYGHFPLWTNGMFSGMPAYQIAMESNNVVSPGWFYYLLTLGLPKPISFFFLACICFYFLSQVLRVNPYIGIIGALAYAYATYNPIIVAAGHDTKMQSIGLMPFVLGSVILVYEGRYWLGGALTALSTALLIGMNHPQIAYYTFLIILFMTIGYAVRWVKEKQLKHLAMAGGIAAAAALAGVLCNAVTLFTTYEYSKASIRGGTELAGRNSSSDKDGLSKDYALSYSLYKSEPFVLMVPKIMGGGNKMEVEEDKSKAIESLRNMPPELAQQLQYNVGFYWGGIGGTDGPPYAGAIICFLTLAGFFVLNSRHKWWILGASLFAILLSWGSYFEGFNTFMLEHLPLYNKFRAPSMTLVIPTLLFCMMAVLTLQELTAATDRNALWERYKKGLMLTGGVFVVLILLYLSYDYTSASDKNLLQQTASAGDQVRDYIRSFLNGLKEDRKGLFMGSLLRSLFFIAAAATLIYLAIRNRVSSTVVIAGVGVLAFIDIMGINSRYLSAENYQEEEEYQASFTPSPADQQLMQDTSFYRVFDLRQGLNTLNYGAATAYFHHSIGGYHPAKLSIYQELIENQLSKFPQSMNLLHMLNTKYIIQADQQGKEQVYPNPENLGAAWFVSHVRAEADANAVMNALTTLNPRDTAIIFARDRAAVTATGGADSAATISLVRNVNDEVFYRYSTAAPRFAVFSEIFYDKGWKAYVNGQELPIIRTNYVLRGVMLPAGQNQELRFEFRPKSYYTGETVSLIAGILVLLALLGAAYQLYRRRKAITT